MVVIRIASVGGSVSFLFTNSETTSLVKDLKASDTGV
jgi:hypothetical protein